jgi:hypothetical protein
MRLNVISSHNPSRQIGGRSKKKSPAVVAGPSWPRHAEDGKRAPEASAWWLALAVRFAFFAGLHCLRASDATGSLAIRPCDEGGDSDLSAAPAIW